MKSTQAFPARRLLMALIFSALSVIGASAQDNTQYFMKVSTAGGVDELIEGSSVTPGYEKQIPIEAFSMETFKNGPTNNGSLSVQMLLDPKAMPQLLREAILSEERTIRITGVVAGETAGSFEKVIELEITGFFQSISQDGVAGDDLFHSLTIGVATLRMTTYPIKPDGTPDAIKTFGWDFLEGIPL